VSAAGTHALSGLGFMWVSVSELPRQWQGKGKGKVHPRTGHEGLEGE